ncbi:MAG: hypothetical protein OHK0013_35550 [Sandaracinaceae bacterium]
MLSRRSGAARPFEPVRVGFRLWLPAVLLGTTIIGAVLAAAPATASAQAVRTVVMPFDGTGADTVREQVHAVLRQDPRLDVVDLDSGASDAGLLVSGSTSGRAARRTFELVASDAQGNELGTQRGRLGRGAPSRRAVEEATRALVDAVIDRIPRPRSASVVENAPVEPPTTSRDESRAGDATPAPGAVGPSHDPAILSVMVGAILRTRSSDVTLTNGGNLGYDSGPYVELAARLELRPLAHDPGLARGLYARAEYGHAVGLGTKQCGGGVCQTFATTFFRVGGDVGLLFDLGGVVELGGGLGFGLEAYQIADNPVIPAVEYPYLRPGIRGRIRVLEELFVIDADVGFRSLFGREGLGTAFGSAGDSFGMDAGLGVGGLFDFGLAWRADFAWAGYWHAFGAGAATPTLGSGQSGMDSGIRAGLTVGYGIR